MYVLDRYINKYFELQDIPETEKEKLLPWDKIVFEQDDEKKTRSIGVYVGAKVETRKKGKYQRKLEGTEKETFEEKQKEALKHFPSFKKQFRQRFKGSIPVTARYQIFSRQTYFYFHAEQRYQFGDFVRNFQKEVGTALFFFQVWARDMVKMSPATDHIVWCNGQNLCCKSNRPLPSVEIEHVLIQSLEWRDIERLKGRCGKLKCSIIYEIDTYLKEAEKYPVKWQKVQIDSCSGCDDCGIMTSFNINTQEVIVKTKDGNRLRLPLADIKRSVEEKKKQKQKNERRGGGQRRVSRPPRQRRETIRQEKKS